MSDSVMVKDYTGRQVIFQASSDGQGLTVVDTTTGVKHVVTGTGESSIPRAVRVQTNSPWRHFTISKIMWNRVVKMYLG